MGHEGTKIIGIVNILADLQPVLGTTLGSIGDIVAGKNSAGQYIVNINKWAKYKPFRSTSPNFATNDGSGTWLTDRKVAAEHAAYGFIENPSAQTSIVQLPQVNYANNTLGHATYQYYRPNGTPYWCRALDFDGYDHNAVPPFKFELNTMYGEEGNGAVVLLGSPVPGWDFRTCLSLSDVANPLAGRPVGMLLCVAGLEKVYFLSSGLDIDGITAGTGSGVGFVFLFSGTQVQTGSEYICHELANTFSGGWVNRDVTAAIIVAPGTIGSQGAFAMKGTYELTNNSCKFLPVGVVDNPENWQTLDTNKSALLGGSQSLELEQDIDRTTLRCTTTGATYDWSKLTVTKDADIYYGHRGSASVSGLGPCYYYNQFGTGTSARVRMNFADGFVKGAPKADLFVQVQYQTSGGLSSSLSVFPTERTNHFRNPDTDYGESMEVSAGASTKYMGFNFITGDNIIILKAAPQEVYCTVKIALDRNMMQELHTFNIKFYLTNQ